MIFGALNVMKSQRRLGMLIHTASISPILFQVTMVTGGLQPLLCIFWLLSPDETLGPDK